MTKLFITFVAVIAIAIAVQAQCPVSSKVTTCTPKCIQDSECSAIGGKCCPNICNAKSCLLPNQLGNKGSDSYKGSTSNTGAGSYCGNIKCNSFEKCELDRSTKRMKCVRA